MLEEANLVEMVVQSPGWKVIENEIATRIGSLTRALIHADEAPIIRDLQANIRGLEFLLKFPGEILEARKRVTEAEAPPKEDGE